MEKREWHKRHPDMTAPSDTPRTNAAAVSREFIAREMDIYAHKFVLADYARELERELSASEEARRKARSEAEGLREERDALVIWLADFNLERERQQTRAETAEREAAEARQKAIKDLEAECKRLADLAGSQGRMAARQYYQQWQSAIRALTTASSPSSGQAHTDHPMRHFDRTCPACVGQENEAALAEERERCAGVLDEMSRLLTMTNSPISADAVQSAADAKYREWEKKNAKV